MRLATVSSDCIDDISGMLCGIYKAMYEEFHVAFLLDELDTIVAYEERGKQKTASAASSYEQGIDAFTSSLGRVQQIELLQGRPASHSSTCVCPVILSFAYHYSQPLII